MARATVTSKGQITIPKEIRDRLGLSAGDGLEFVVDEEGNLMGTPLRSAAAGALAGCLRHLAGDSPVTLAEMDEAIRQSALDRDVSTRDRRRRRAGLSHAERSGPGAGGRESP